MKDARLVYSSNPALNQKCPKCKELDCVCAPTIDPAKIKFIAVMRIEKQARGGKTVTVIDKLPKNAEYLKALSTLLKRKCGTGGTYSLDGLDGIIEIQGDKREQIRGLLEKEGIKVKG